MAAQTPGTIIELVEEWSEICEARGTDRLGHPSKRCHRKRDPANQRQESRQQVAASIEFRQSDNHGQREFVDWKRRNSVPEGWNEITHGEIGERFAESRAVCE